jgi:hypothetical protein
MYILMWHEPAPGLDCTRGAHTREDLAEHFADKMGNPPEPYYTSNPSGTLTFCYRSREQSFTGLWDAIIVERPYRP